MAGNTERLVVLREVLEISRLLSWQGSVVDHIVAAGFAEWVASALRDTVVDSPEIDDAWLLSADAILGHALGRWAPITHNIQGERIVILDSLQRLHTKEGNLRKLAAEQWAGGGGGSAASIYRGPLCDSVRWLDEISKAAIAAAEATGSSVRAADMRLKNALDRFVASGSSPTAKLPALGIVLVDFHRPIRQDRRTRILLAGTRVVLAIERHRVATGKLPASLAQLGDLLPKGYHVDPVTEQPWDYERVDVGYSLASRPQSGVPSDHGGIGPPRGIIIVGQTE